MWNPDVYLAFADHRGRPFVELLARVGVHAPRRIVDLGCGPGNLTVTLAERFPDAVVEGLDSSPDMVSAAVALGVSATVGSIVDWVPEPDTDLVVSNAALQWVPDHVALLRRWVRELPTDGWLAIQVPGNVDAPSHRAVREVALRPQFVERLRDIRFCSTHLVETPEGYADVLSEAGCEVDAWETTYVQTLTGDTPVLDWLTGTTLTDIRDRLSEQDWQSYRRQIIPLLADAYPKRADGTTFFPFRRIFVVARVTR